MFTNASNVVIGGKEVQSIVTSNGGVLYQKQSPTPTPTVSSVSLASDKSILSAYHSESATLSATVSDSNNSAVSGVTVEFFNGSTSLGTSTTNSNGVATKSYSATGSGDVSLTATSSNVSSTAITVEDCLFYGIDTTAFTIPSNTTFTSDGTKITATTNTSNEKIVYFNHIFSNNDNWLFETEIAQLGTVQSMAVVWNDNTYYGGEGNNANYVYSYMGSQTKWTYEPSVGDVFKVVRENGDTSVYFANHLIETKTINHKSSFKIGYFINRNRTQYYKNIKIKAL